MEYNMLMEWMETEITVFGIGKLLLKVLHVGWNLILKRI